MRHSIALVAKALQRVRIHVGKEMKDWRDGSVLHTLTQVIRFLTFAKATHALSNRELANATQDVPYQVRRKLGLGTPLSSSFVFNALRRMPLAGWPSLLADQFRQLLKLCPHVPSPVPGGMIIVDGKKIASGAGEAINEYCQHTIDDKGNKYWYINAMRACVVVGMQVLCAGQFVMPAGMGEVTAFKTFLTSLRKSLGDAFPRCISIDAGLATMDNLRAVIAEKLDYIAQIKGNNTTLFARMKAAFAQVSVVAAESYDVKSGKRIWRRLYRIAAPAGSPEAPDAAQWWKVQHTVVEMGTGETHYMDHYYVTSLAWMLMKPRAILRAIRLHWTIENGSNWTADVIFHEDTHQPCNKDNGIINNSWLLMLAINLVTLIRMLLPPRMAWLQVTRCIRDALARHDVWEGRTSPTPA